MPEFHPDIKDLIARMITVEPSQRIAIAAIKDHPAFRIALPRAYVVPAPIPLIDLSAPIDPELVTDDVRQQLERIGLAADELGQLLRMHDRNIAKLFVLVLLRRLQCGLDVLPWDCAAAAVVEVDFPEVVFEAAEVIDSQRLESSEKVVEPERSSPERFSFARKAEWMACGDTVEFDAQFEFGPIKMPLAPLMAQLQKMFVQAGFRFFHPNDITLIAKDDQGGFAVATGVCAGEGMVAWTLQVKGVTADLAGACTAFVTEHLNSLENGS
jgi:hypothetical protein